VARTSYSEFREIIIEKDAEPTLIHKFLTSHFFGSLQRNTVRTDASKDWTVSHTVPLRGGAMQIDASAYCFWYESFHSDRGWGDTAVLQTA